MGERRYGVAPEIFRKYPGYVRGVVIAHGVENGPSPSELVGLLREAEAGLRARLTPERLAEEPRIAAWREAYRAFGARPSEHRASIEALARRVLKGEPLPSITALVDIGNLVSLRHLLPAGCHAIDRLAGDIALRLAVGTERFVPFGSDREESPQPGEVIFAEGETVLTRRWTWRQATHTLTLPESRAVLCNLDGLPPVEAGEIEAAGREVMGLIDRFCGGRSRFALLSEASPEIGLGA